MFLIERESIEKKSGKRSCENALGITSQTPQQACAQQVLAINRRHWTIESTHYIIDWNYAPYYDAQYYDAPAGR